MFVCGITPYDATHLGHAATYLAFDMAQRVWRDAGHPVRYVQNVTDVDDPLLERAAAIGQDWAALAASEIDLFRDDMAALRVLPPDEYVGVVESVGDVVGAVAQLLADGAAYWLDGDVYFRVSAARDFGYESGCDAATMTELFAQRGGDPDRPGKRDPLDSLLWRGPRPGEPRWDTELGRGRPGWHIECAVIALRHLGMGIDVQGGGSDLIFPHHEHSAALAEALTGAHPFARHYVHTGMIGLDGEKMSKSRGNLVFVSKLREAGVEPMAIRLALLDGHYRADREWTDAALVRAGERLARWRAAVRLPDPPDARALLAEMRDRLADDLDTAGALDAVDQWAVAALASGSAVAGPGASGAGDGDPAALVRDLVDGLLGVRL